MTSKRNIENRIEELEDQIGEEGDTTIVVRETVHGTEWSGSELAPGETETTVREVEL